MRPSVPLLATLLVLGTSHAAAQAQELAPMGEPALAQPSISPDGGEIAFVSGGDIWVAPASGGDAHLLVSDPATESRPLHSPDGRRLAFVSNRAGSDDLYVLDRATGVLSRVTWGDAGESLDAWSPDGEWLYFTSSVQDINGMTDVFRVRASGGTPIPVAADRFAPEFFAAPSPDGGTLALAGRGRMAYSQWWRNGHSHIDESEIWLVDRAGQDAPTYRRLSGTGAKHLWPLWTDDGSAVVYMSDRSGSENLWLHPLEGEPRPLTRFQHGRVLWPTISGDGATLAFERDFGIWTADVETGQARAVPIRLRGAVRHPSVEHLRITSDFSDLALSPDGKKLAFVARGDVFATSADDGGPARRVTSTPAPEAEPAWAPDSRRIAYTSRRSGTMRVHLYDFGTGLEREVATTGSDHATPVFSPDGSSLAYVRDGEELVVQELDSGRERVVARAQLWRPPFGHSRPLAWSPDGDWLAFFATDGRMFTNVHVAPADGSAPAVAVSRLANSFAGSLAWSPDGTSLYFDTQHRTEDGQIARVDLVPRVPRFREAQFDSLFQTEEESESAEAGSPQPDPDEVGSAEVEVVIDTAGIHRRLQLLPLGVDAGSMALSPDGRTLVFLASAEGQLNLYSWNLDPLSDGPPVARQLTSTPGGKSTPWFGPDGREVFFLDRGRLRAVEVESGDGRSIDAVAELDKDFHQEKQVVFDQAWSYMRDHFYDADMHGADWQAIRGEWEPRVAAAQNPQELERLMDLMLGELNASHLGHTEPTGRSAETGRLGVRWSPAALVEGRHVAGEVIPLGPAAVAGIDQGETVVVVDGEPLDEGESIERLLENRVGDRVRLTVRGTSGSERDITLKPISTGAEGELAYRAWVESRRRYVDRISDGRLGYVHMPDMGWGSLQQLIVDLDAATFGKDGVVIDVRANNGGFVNAYALDVFARRGYITMEVRGYPTVPARSMLGQRSLELPTVLVTDMHSLSDAEDFAEGYRTLELGPIVGEPTAGWIIYTWGTGLVDGSYLRMPRSRIRASDGEVMEMNPRPVDVPVVRPLGESYEPGDRQLDAAVRVLLDQLS